MLLFANYSCHKCVIVGLTQLHYFQMKEDIVNDADYDEKYWDDLEFDLVDTYL